MARPTEARMSEEPSRHLFVHTLAGAGRIGYRHAECVAMLRDLCRGMGWRCTVKRFGGAGVERGRNLGVAEFLRDPALTDFVSIDSGLSFDSAAVVTMARSPFDVIGAAYPAKSIDWKRVRDAALAGIPAGLLPWIASDPILSATAEQLAAPIYPP